MRHHIVLLVGLGVAFVGFVLSLLSVSMWKVHKVPWGLLVALYEYYGIFAAGSAALASFLIMARAVGIASAEAERVARLGLVLAIAGLLVAGFTVAVKSGLPTNVYYTVISGKFESAIARMILLLSITIILSAAVLLATLAKGMEKIKIVLASLLMIFAVLTYANAGSVFQSMASVPMWYSTPVTALFVAGMLVWGASAQSIYALLAERRLPSDVARAYGMAIVAGALAYAVVLYFTSMGYTWVAAEAWSKISTSALFVISFYILSFIVPIAIGLYVVLSGSYTTLPIAAASALIGGFVVHTMVVIIPQTLALTGFREIVEIEYFIASDEIVGMVGTAVLLLGLLIVGVPIVRMLEQRAGAR